MGTWYNWKKKSLAAGTRCCFFSVWLFSSTSLGVCNSLPGSFDPQAWEYLPALTCFRARVLSLCRCSVTIKQISALTPRWYILYLDFTSPLINLTSPFFTAALMLLFLSVHQSVKILPTLGFLRKAQALAPHFNCKDKFIKYPFSYSQIFSSLPVLPSWLQLILPICLSIVTTLILDQQGGCVENTFPNSLRC